MMNVYVVMVTPEASHSKISQEGYLSLAAAKEFIESRKPEPKVPSYNRAQPVTTELGC